MKIFTSRGKKQYFCILQKASGGNGPQATTYMSLDIVINIGTQVELSTPSSKGFMEGKGKDPLFKTDENTPTPLKSYGL